MLVVHHNNRQCIIRPVPLVSITQNVIRNKTGLLGSYYDITLNGTILPDEGSPFYVANGGSNHGGPNTPELSFTNVYNRPGPEAVGIYHAMSSIISKQNLIRELFKSDGQKIELLPASVVPESTDTSLSDEPVLTFYPTVQSINFEEGIYLNACKYTISLRAEVLLDANDRIISDGLINSTYSSGDSRIPVRQFSRKTIDEEISSYGGFIEDYTESWSLEVEEGKGNTNTSQPAPAVLPENHINSIRTYRLTRNINATGRTIYKDDTRYDAWEQAKGYVYKSVLGKSVNGSTDTYKQHPELSALSPLFASGFLNVAKSAFGGFNHTRTESFDITAGTFTLSDSWLLSSGTPAYEDYRMSLSKSSDNGLWKVSIDGNIKGLSSNHAGSSEYGGTNPNLSGSGQYHNALKKYNEVTNNGAYGPNCYIFKRASQVISDGLNHVPLSVSLGTNPFTGEITYTVEYDSRPFNAVSGALSESISCNDTYPGDVFAVIPVIGRQTGPIIQYIGGRTEYQRNLTIDLTMDRYYTYNSGVGIPLRTQIRQLNVLSKPSINEPYKSQIAAIIEAYSPKNEIGIRKYFVNPPVETWDARTGRYSLQINWTYELNR
jgi:peptidoglycan hydrolase-like protein with peptidoglycan-binding domain